jgi:hypothetical protein
MLRRPIAHGRKEQVTLGTGYFNCGNTVEISAIAGQPRAFRYDVTVVLVAVFFLFSLGAKVAAGPFGFLFLILRLSSKKIMKRLLAGYKAHLERTYTKPTFSGPMADFFA